MEDGNGGGPGGVKDLDFPGEEGVGGEGATLRPKIYNIFFL